MANTSKKIYNITVDGSAITYFERTQGQSGRDIAAVKLALGDIYMAPRQNNSPEDESTGEAWFSCDTNQELSIERLLAFDKKFKSSLMAFQLKHQFLILSYYFEKYFIKNIRTNDDQSLAEQYSFMLTSFDIEFGTIGESTIAILHGYRPGSNASNTSFVCSESNPIDMIPIALYNSYMNGEIMAMPDAILSELYSKQESAFDTIESSFSSVVSATRNWKNKLPQTEVAYAKYNAHSYINNLKESDLYIATKEVLEFVRNPQYTEELTPAQRERLVSRAFEPDHLLDPDPFIISMTKIGFFDRTPYTFRNLPEFENLSSETRDQLELQALNKVLSFYEKQQVTQISNPNIINFIDFRTPSLRPGDVYRAYFEIDRALIDEQPDPVNDQNIIVAASEITSNANEELQRTNQEIDSLFCADGGDPSDEDVRVQYERYRSFAAKKKLEITRKIRQAILQEQERDITIDGVQVDLGIFGKGSMSENEIRNLLASGASSLTNLALSGLGELTDLSTAGTSASTNGDELKVNYIQLVKYIEKVAENFEKAQKDLANFQLSGDPYFSAINEASHLKKLPTAIKKLIGGDITLRKATTGVDLDNWVSNSQTEIVFKFSDVSLGSRIESVRIQSLAETPTISSNLFKREVVAEQIETGQDQIDPQEGVLTGALKRYRTVHYLRNILDLFGKSSTLDGFLNQLANPQGTCDTDEEEKTGTGAEYILRYTKGVSRQKSPNSYNPVHNWRNPSGKKALDTINKEIKSVASRKDKEFYGFIKTGVELEKVFGFEKALPQLGDIDTTTWDSANKDLGDKLLKELSSLLNYKRLLCEYAACLGIPDVQVSLPNISIPEWPKLPMLELPGSDFKEQLYKMFRDIVYRALYTFIKGIIDILKTPFCSEKFIADLYGAASDTSPLIKKALAEGFLDTGIPASKTQSAKDLIDALLGLLTPSELCALLNGEIVNDSVYHIMRATAEAFNLRQELETEEQITNFFITLGIFVGPQICENLSRYNNIQETCEDIYSIVGQVRSAILQGEDVTQEQLNAASNAAKEEYEKKRDALNFLAGEGGLADLLPDLSSLENNPIFSTPSEFIVESAKLAASSALRLSKTSFVRSLNSFVSSFYVDEQRLAQPGDDVYEPAANRLVQRATCNLQRFSAFIETTDFNIENLSNRDATDSLREAIIILADDYETQEVITGTGTRYRVYKLAPRIRQGRTVELLQNPLSSVYFLKDEDREEASTLSLSSNQQLVRIWEYMLPISVGDLDGATRTISSFADWSKPIFRGEGLASEDILTLNLNYLNKMNQLLSRLQQDISSNIEKSFRIAPKSKFLSGIGTFYNIEEEASESVGATPRGELIRTSDFATTTTLRHPILPDSAASIKFTDERRVIGDEDHVLTRVTLKDSFFFGTDPQKVFSSCEKVPDSLITALQSAEYSRDIKKTLFLDFFNKNINKYRRSYFQSDTGFSDSVTNSLLQREFKEINEGIIEQLVSEVRDSRIFNDPAYLARIDSKLKSRFYYDPQTKCFKNPNNLLKYGVFNYDKLVTDEFEQQYRKEYARPENSDILRDYSKPGAFEKALMNTSILGFIRITLLELLLKGSISFSVWDFDFLKSNKFFRDYIVSFMENQISRQEFFQSNRERLDETLIRLSGVNNIAASIRKITLRQVDTVVSDLSKTLYENDGNIDYDIWFLDNIPLVGVPDLKQRSSLGEEIQLWVSNLQLRDVEKFRKNHFAYLEEYVRINGPLRDFESSYAQIARAQADRLSEVLPVLRAIDRATNLTMPRPRFDRIRQESSIDINMYNDQDSWPNRELLSVSEFSEVIRSLLDNNKELSKYFHDFQNKIYTPENPVTHGIPQTLEDKFPSRPIIRTRKRYKFENKNIFSSMFSEFSEISADAGAGGNIVLDPLRAYIPERDKIKKKDKFRIQNKVNIQPKDSGYYWGLIHETSDISPSISLEINESSIGDILRKSLGEAEEYEDRYYIATTTLQSALEQLETRTRNPADYNIDNGLKAPMHTMAASTDENGLNTLISTDLRGIEGPQGTFRPQEDPEERDLIQLNGETLFQNITQEVSKEQYEFILSSSAEPEYWEETIIDLVGDASPIFNQPGNSEFDTSQKLSNAQKIALGEKVNRLKFWFDNRDRNALRLATPRNTNANPDKYVFTVGLDQGNNRIISQARLSKPFGHIVHDEDGDGWDFPGLHYTLASDFEDGNTDSENEFRGCFDLTYASNNVRYSKTSGTGRRIFQIDQPYELLGLNDYKIPLRILITQVKNSSGDITQVYVKYIIPEFAHFNKSDDDSYRAEALVKACRETMDSYERFIEDTVYDVLQEAKISDRPIYDQYRNILYSDGIVNKRALKPSSEAIQLIDRYAPKSGKARRTVPPLRFPAAGGDSSLAKPFFNTLAASWISISKLYSIAAQNEAKAQTRNFQVTVGALDEQFMNPGKLVLRPKIGISTEETITALGYNQLQDPYGSNRSFDPRNLSPGAQEQLRNIRLYQRLQEHYLYRHSMKDMLDPLTGRSNTIISNPSTKAMQTIGNFVSWFNQRRADAFFGFTSKKDVYTVKRLNEAIDSGISQDYLRNSAFSDYEAPSHDCGPSLFYGDGRMHWLSLVGMTQNSIEMSYYNSVEDALGAFQKYLNLASTTFSMGQIGALNVHSRALGILGTNSAFFNAQDISNLFRNLQFRKLPEEYLPQNMDDFVGRNIEYADLRLFNPSNQSRTKRVLLPLVNPFGVGVAVFDGFAVAEVSDLREIGLYYDPNLGMNEIIERDYMPNLMFQVVIQNDFGSLLEQETSRVLSYPDLITSITAQYNAALELTGLPQIIREVTTTYVSKLEGDENIITDIVNDSQISHGLRIMLASPYDDANAVDTKIVDSWVLNSEVSEEERMGVVLIGDTQYKTYPVTQYEQDLTSLECFMAATPLQFRNKLTEQLPYMKCKLQNEQAFKDFFDFIVPYKTYASMLAMHGITMLSGYGDMPTIMDSAKSGLAGAFSQAAEIPDQQGFAIDFDSSDLVAAFGTPGPVGGQKIDCFDLPNIKQWWQLIKEMIKQYVKYFPSIILRGIADSIDPAYKEMKRHYLSCELPDLTNESWAMSSGAGRVPLGLRGGQNGTQDSMYAPLIPAFPVDLAKGITDLPDPEYLTRSIDKLIGYIYGGPLPLLDPTYAFKIPCLELDQQSPSDWAAFNVGNSGRYGQPLSLITFLALSTYELPNDLEMRRNICNRQNIEDVVACQDEEE